MPARSFLLLSVTFLIANSSCGGGDKHLPSSNPPEYDPKKVYTAPAAPPSAPATVAKPTELERLQSQLQSLESGQKQKGEGKKVPVNPDLLQLFKGVTNPCGALSRLAPGMGSGQLYAGNEGAALKKALGPDADGIARRMDEQLAEGLKHSLGPGAADCPISVRPRKSSGLKDLSRPARLVLTHASSTQPLLLVQTTMPDTSQDDYEVEKHSSRENAPPGWVGWKMTDTMTRIGKKPATEGVRELYEMVIAPKAMKCPSPDGVVPGEFHWSLKLMRATTGSDGTQGVLYSRKVDATLKGQVDDNAKVQYVDVDATVTLQHIGTDLPYYSHVYTVHARFTIDQKMAGIPQELSNITVSDFSVGEAEAKDAQLVGNLTILVTYYSGQEYYAAQGEWNKPNTCVEIMFTPATKTKKLGPNESVPVKTELRTKKEQAVVSAKFKEATERPREGNGTVSPKQAESKPGSPATFDYKMPEKRVKHSGFWVGAVSRAGVAQALDGEWEVADSGLRLRFGHRIKADPPPRSNIGQALFDGAVQFEIPLEPYTEGLLRGEINVVRPLLVVRHVRPAAHPCSGSGSQVEHWLVTAHVDPKSESMTVQFGYVTSNEQASWTCTGPAGAFTDNLYVDLPGSLESVHMPTKTGTKKDVNARNLDFLEWLSVTVVEGLD